MSLKRVCVCSAQVPFVYGGTEVLMEELIRQIQMRGHLVEAVRLPLQTQPHEELIKSCLAWRMINLDFVELDTIDLVLCSRFPSYMAPHKTISLQFPVPEFPDGSAALLVQAFSDSSGSDEIKQFIKKKKGFSNTGKPN